MRKIILITILSCISVVSVIGQCAFPEPDDYGLFCDEAKFLCGYEMDGFMGQLLTDLAPLPQPDPLCGGGSSAENIQWFSFIPDDTIVEIVISYSNCTNNQSFPGLQVGLYNSCELPTGPGDEGGSFYCESSINYNDIVLTPDSGDIEAGQLYYLFIDGYASAACEFEIDVIQGICVEEPDTTQICAPDCGIVTNESNTSCTLAIDTFAFSPSGILLGGGCGTDLDELNISLDSILCIEWNIQPNTGFNYISSSFEYFDSLGVVPTLIVEWTDPGIYTIEPIIHLNPLFASCGGGCNCTDDVVFTIEIIESLIVQLQPIDLCPGECVDFCGETYCQTGVYQCFDEDMCVLTLQPIIESPNIIIDEGTLFFCPGECYEFQDMTYCAAGPYEVSAAATCDTTYLFELEEVSLFTNLIQADALINCDLLQATLEGEWNTNFTGTVNSAWISETGDTLVHGTVYNANDGGDYTFVVWPENMRSCEVSITHTVIKDDGVPTADLIPPLLDCNNPMDIITIDTQADIMSVDWTGPNGFASTDVNPQVDEAGIYEVTITATNGCQLIVDTEVIGDFVSPDVDVDYENLTCSEDIPTAIFSSTATIVSHQWNLPDGSNSSLGNLNLNNSGSYSLEVTAANGCTTTEFFNVMDQSYDPSLNLNEDRIWRCMDTLISLDLSAQEVPGLRYIWTTLEGSVESNTINLLITSPGTYILTIIDDAVECISHDTVRITEDPNPFLDVELSTLPPVCEGGSDGSVEVMAFGGGTEPYIFEMDGEQYTDIANISLEPGNYSMDVIDVFGCTVSKDFEVPETVAFTVDIEPELEIRFGQTKKLNFDTNLDDSEIGLIEWTDVDGVILGMERELSFVGKQLDFIYLRVEDLEGCEVTKEVKINLSFDVDIYYPNVFSPNGDGNNDLFILYNNGFPEMADDLKIFDRFGELIYKSDQTEFNETKAGWDGTFNGKPCQPGVYVFILQYTLMNGSPQVLSGSITLVR